MLPIPPTPGVTPAQSFVVAKTRDFSKLWCVYHHHDANDTLVYIGVCKLTELFSLPDARQNSEWVKRFGDDEPVIIKLQMVCEDVVFCNNTRFRQVQELKPVCNMIGFSYGLQRVRIVCDQTGETFDSISEAARAHNLTQSALSNHVNRKRGHNSVKGRTYRKEVG